MKNIVWPLLIFIIAWVLGAYLGIPLKSVVMPVYSLLPVTMWMVVALLLVVAFLLFLIEGARRFHQRMVNEIYQAHEGLAKEYADNEERIQWLTLILGMAAALCSLLDRWELEARLPLTKMDIQCLEADLRSVLQNRLGLQYAEGHFDDLG